jgi:hypothetical protein
VNFAELSRQILPNGEGGEGGLAAAQQQQKFLWLDNIFLTLILCLTIVLRSILLNILPTTC